MYTVSPSYYKIPPRENLIVKINYFFKTSKEDLTKHKFKFECFKLEENDTSDLKDLFRKMEDKPERHLLIYSQSRNVSLEYSEKNESDFLKLNNNNFHNDTQRLNETYNLQVFILINFINYRRKKKIFK